ncbi:MAG: tetratricopeptide repeat protein [Bacteroidota bacterium]
MLKAQKKLSKREIKEDKLVTSYFEATSWYEHNKKLVSSVVTGLILVAVVAVVVVNNMRSNNEKATSELGKVLRLYDEGRFDLAIDGNPQQNVRGLQAIVDDYGSTNAGELATFYLASAYYAQGNYDKALEYFLDVNLDDPMISSSGLAGVAACYEVKADHARAAEYFERAAFNDPRGVLAAEHIMHAAQNFVKAGNREKAVDLYKLLKRDYPTSSYVREIDRYIAEASS